MNFIEMLPCDDGVTVVLTTPEGDISWQLLSWEEFERMRAAVEREQRVIGEKPWPTK